jgi:hypothetical protein
MMNYVILGEDATSLKDKRAVVLVESGGEIRRAESIVAIDLDLEALNQTELGYLWENGVSTDAKEKALFEIKRRKGVPALVGNANSVAALREIVTELARRIAVLEEALLD